MNEEQLKEALSVSDEHPVIKAFLQIISDQEESEVLAGILPNLSAEDRAYNCGRKANFNDSHKFHHQERCNCLCNRRKFCASIGNSYTEWLSYSRNYRRSRSCHCEDKAWCANKCLCNKWR